MHTDRTMRTVNILALLADHLLHVNFLTLAIGTTVALVLHMSIVRLEWYYLTGSKIKYKRVQ